MMPPPLPLEIFDAFPLAVLYHIRTLESIVGQQAERILLLEAQAVTLTARVAEIEARLTQNSSNSHRPSFDGPPVKPAPPRKPSGKKRGGQQDHPKHERVLLPADETHERKSARCRRCCATIAGDDPNPIIDQVGHRTAREARARHPPPP